MYKRSTVLVIVGFTGMLAGCLDASPISVPTTTIDPIVIDAGVATNDAPIPIDAYAHPECRACIAADPLLGPGCGDRLANCINESEHCIDIYECAYVNGCVTKKTQNESISCAVPCATALGITNVTNSSIQLAIRLTECFHGSCAKACEVGE
jgi:hypothetical protein